MTAIARSLCLAGLCALTARVAAADERTDFFEKNIRPVLVTQCAECHSGDTPEGDLLLGTREAIIKGGMNGPSLKPGIPEASLIFTRLITEDKDLLMPPEKPLTKQQIDDFRRWIKDGAVWPSGMEMWDDKAAAASDADHWSFKPVVAPPLPDVKNADWVKSPIDRYVLAKLEAHELTPVEPADRRTLLRRATLDLTGLPPTPEDVDVFLADESPEAFATVVDRLLASEAYGERWGRHWLDVARYADTSGDGTDMPIPEARYYRDYVIDAFNRDMPFDQFLIEQVAGDILAKQDPDNPRAHEQIIATGFIALSRRFGNSKYAEMDLIVENSIDTIGRGVLGLTLGCCRCHHHKFDPVTMEDYYGLYGYFSSTVYPHAGTEHQKERADFIPINLTTDELKQRYDSPLAWAVKDSQKTGDQKVFMAGDPRKGGELAPRGFLSIIDESHPEIPKGESGRLELGKWLGSRDNPLTLRVIANRVWQWHFGKGLAPTTDNFGKQSPAPQHLELLDWLASDFVDNAWSFKSLHRRILLSSTYQLSSRYDEQNAKLDQPNTWLWHFERQRMDAEAARDSILSVSGTLEPGSNGRHPFPPEDKLKFTQGNPFSATYDHHHRTVYLMTPRLTKHPFLALFDGPDTNISFPSRSESTVPLQALFVLNSPFVREQSTSFARRMMEHTADPQGRLRFGYELALSRPPVEDELAEMTAYVDSYAADLRKSGMADDKAEQAAWSSVARTLLGSNEFLYVD